MYKKQTRRALTLTLLTAIILADITIYYTFQKNKKPVETPQVQGIQDTQEIPYPPHIYNRSITETTYRTTVTFYTKQEPSQVHTYYKRVLAEQGWKLKDKETNMNGFVTITFIKGTNKLKVSTNKIYRQTLVLIEEGKDIT